MEEQKYYRTKADKESSVVAIHNEQLDMDGTIGMTRILCESFHNG